jgi:divalent anion:Na+ symporter, DASS family
MIRLLSEHKAIIKEILATTLSIVIAMCPPPSGLENKAILFFAGLVWGISNWTLNIMPAFATGLMMLSIFVLTGVAKFEIVFAQFAGSNVWLILGALAIGGAVSKSGLLSRVCLFIMKIFPPTFAGQTAALLWAGVFIGPFIPSSTVKVAIAGSFSTRMGELLGFADRSKGMNGLFLAMYTGFSLLAPIFVSSSIFAYIILSAIPREEAIIFTFGYWAKCMLPWGIFVLLISYIVITCLYKPKEQCVFAKNDIDALLTKLGKMGKDEIITAIVLIVCIVSWVLEKVIAVTPAIPAVLGMCVLFLTKVLSARDFRTCIDWDTVVFLGTIFGLSSLVTKVGIDKWLEINLAPFLVSVNPSLYLLIILLGILVFLSRFLIVSGGATIGIYVVLMVPFCRAAGINCWLAGITAYVMCQPFLVKYQNINFISGYGAAGGDKKINFSSLSKYCLIYHTVALLGLLLSVPYWKAIGLFN